jgi:hypothetical protein
MSPRQRNRHHHRSRRWKHVSYPGNSALSQRHASLGIPGFQWQAVRVADGSELVWDGYVGKGDECLGEDDACTEATGLGKDEGIDLDNDEFHKDVSGENWVSATVKVPRDAMDVDSHGERPSSITSSRPS